MLVVCAVILGFFLVTVGIGALPFDCKKGGSFEFLYYTYYHGCGKNTILIN
jgi:hypothetical protein